MSRPPDLVQNTDQNDRQSAPNKQDSLFAIVPDDRKIVFNVCILIEELVSSPKDDKAAKQKNDGGESKCDPQRWKTSLLKSHHQDTVRLHAKRVRMIPITCYDASVGFSGATEERVAIPSLEIMRRKEALRSAVTITPAAKRRQLRGRLRKPSRPQSSRNG